MARNELLRLWVPHKKTVEMLGVLGRRYERNQSASAMLREAARICRIFAAEATYDGQQVTVVAQDVLLRHAVTGQMPVEDLHPDAILAWVAPVSGRDPAEVANERARIPASGLLPNTPDQPDDNEIELLRRPMCLGDQQVVRERALREELRHDVRTEPLRITDCESAVPECILDANPRRTGAQPIADHSASREQLGALIRLNLKGLVVTLCDAEADKKRRRTRQELHYILPDHSRGPRTRLQLPAPIP